jgi:membrane protease YdiL (CAAX protease family)
MSYLIPLGYSTVTYSIAWLTGIAALNTTQTADAFSRFFGLGSLSRPFGIGLYFLVVATIGVIQNCATTLGEEIGWRGFLVPELAKGFSFTATAALSGVIWALCHVPIISRQPWMPVSTMPPWVRRPRTLPRIQFWEVSLTELSWCRRARPAIAADQLLDDGQL